MGEFVAPSSAGGGLTRTAIVTLADLSTLEVEVDVNEAYIARIRGDQPARITLDAWPERSCMGPSTGSAPRRRSSPRRDAPPPGLTGLADHRPGNSLARRHARNGGDG